MLAIRNILHPTDFSPLSRQAFHLACSLARDHGAKLTLLYVQERPPIVYAGGFGAMMPPPAEEEHDRLMQELMEMRPPDVHVRVDHVVEEGDPALTIVDVARRRDCDLIIMGTHGRSGLGRWVLGSVAEKVMRNAPCPVLTMKQPFAEAEAELTREQGGVLVY